MYFTHTHTLSLSLTHTQTNTHTHRHGGTSQIHEAQGDDPCHQRSSQLGASDMYIYTERERARARAPERERARVRARASERAIFRPKDISFSNPIYKGHIRVISSLSNPILGPRKGYFRGYQCLQLKLGGIRPSNPTLNPNPERNLHP